MRRRNFIKNFAITGLGVSIFPQIAFSKENDPNYWRLVGFLLPLLAEPVIKAGIEWYTGVGGNDKGHKGIIVNNTITNVIESAKTDKDYKKIGIQYEETYERIIKPAISTSRLNGVGFSGTDSTMREVMNDSNQKATTPVHTVKDLKTFDRDTWSRYCDISNIQVGTYGERIYVSPQDDRAERYKGTFYIPERFSYLIYQPEYYCYGLPIEDPVQNIVSESKKREIKQKTGKTTNTNFYFTQRYYYLGAFCAPNSGKISTIYWNHDDVITEFFGLGPINACGDPNIECDGDKPKDRPYIER